MSTEHQQYSLKNQSDAIHQYATDHRLSVVKTYIDAGKSGLGLKNRIGLTQLLQDVVGGTREFEAILVYDVSRWGRFQDADEAAHYEFLCKRAGINVHYCAEPFANDDTISSSILKALKRSMAAEYSRELGVKVYAGKKRLVELGFRVGGAAGYGLRRMLLSAEGQHKQKLAFRERKSLQTDRVILVPGPKSEVECVRLMYRMGLRKTYREIADELNVRGIRHPCGKPWNWERVKAVLANPKYTGCNVWGRTSARLRTRRRPTEGERWIFSPIKFEPLIDQRTFDRVQAAHPNNKIPMPNAVLLEKLRGVLAVAGKLQVRIMRQFPGVPDPSTYRNHFGSLRAAFELAGYHLSSRELAISDQHARRRRLQERLIAQVGDLFPNQVRIRIERNRTMLIAENGVSTMPITIALCYRTRVQKLLRWALRVPLEDQHLTTLICLSNEAGDRIESFHILDGVYCGTRYNLTGEDDPLLQQGQRLNRLADLRTLGNWVQPEKQTAKRTPVACYAARVHRKKASSSNPTISAEGKRMLSEGARRAHAAIRASGRIPGEEGRAAVARNREARRRDWQQRQVRSTPSRPGRRTDAVF